MSVTATTIANCFRHTSFDTAPDASDKPLLEEPAVPDSFATSDEVAASWKALHDAGVVPDSESFCDYVSEDSEVVATEQLPDDDILRAVNDRDKSSDDDSVDERETKAPTASEALDAVDVLRRYFGAHEGGEDGLNIVAAAERAIGQVAGLEAIRVKHQPMDQGVITSLKRQYRRSLLQKMLLCLESNKQYVVNLLAVVHLLSNAWSQVTEATIVNSFRHAGSVAPDDDNAPDSPTQDCGSDNKEEAALLSSLGSKGAVVDMSTYVSIDNDVETCRADTIDSIIEEVLKVSSEGTYPDDKEDARPGPKPVSCEAADAHFNLLPIENNVVLALLTHVCTVTQDATKAHSFVARKKQVLPGS
ncbi:hypothetical protein HPB50_009140 [Hyalomma asiaticum]|uniref:Uncharacterized protein n=1 Tax=Hyalomma asiaticum TaxID=266040 RepID=A0ACB7SUP8_HYAAI|nr:hypothetical protein HPB50_009140 [Hyalomma asiaticum]